MPHSFDIDPEISATVGWCKDSSTELIQQKRVQASVSLDPRGLLVAVEQISRGQFKGAFAASRGRETPNCGGSSWVP